MTAIPASIRHKNPGAMWPGASSKRFGAVKSSVLNDGQRNQIATFPTSVDGGAALFDLLYRVYGGKRIGDAISKWCGGNDTNDYLAAIENATGYDRNDYLTKGFIEDAETAIPFAEAMAEHEAGREYPMSAGDWEKAHAKFLASLTSKPVVAKAKPLPTSLLEKFAAASDADLGQKEVGFDPVRAAVATQQIYAAAIDRHIDKVARSKDYASGHAMAGYVTDPVWSAEARAFVDWRSAVWVYAYQELANVQAGKRSLPSVAQLIAELPALDA